MNKNLKSISVMMIGTFLNAVLGFLTVPFITRIVSPSDYGEFSLLQTYMSVITSIALLGFDQAYVRYYFRINSIAYKQYLTKRVITIPIVFSIIAGVLFLISSDKLISDKYIQFLMLACILVTVAETFTRLNLRMEQDSINYSIALIAHRIIYGLTAIALLLNVPNNDIASLFIATIFSLAASIMVTLFTKSNIWFGKSKNLVLDSQTKHILGIKALLFYSIPFVFANITNWIFGATGKLFLQKYATYADIGYYSAATNIMSLVAIFNTTFSTIWVPMAIEHYENNPEDKSFFVRSNDLVTYGMVVIGMIVVLFKDVIGWVLGGDYTLATFICPCLMLYPLLFAISETTVYGINFYKKTHLHIVISVSSCIANILGNILLVPLLGGKGAAISMGLSSIVILIVRTLLSNMYYKVNFHYGKMFSSVVLVTMFCIYATFSKTNLTMIIFFIIAIILISIIYKDVINNFLKLVKNIILNRRLRKLD